MKRDLVEMLVCPMCRGPLLLRVDAEAEDGEVEKGALLCQRCNESYPIQDSIPNLLPPDLRR